MQPGSLNPASLLPGTRVGPWRIVDARGRGTYGAIYLAEGVAPEASGLVALKLALHPWDERFGREAELLSRIRHPCVPRLFDQGQWLSPAGLPHPWLAMELVEGIPLYEAARVFAPSSRQVLRLLAGLARALEATHAVGGVHRDVKGDNMLVRLSDGQPFLIDFGSGTYPGAAPLTGPVFPPGTPPYRSPEAYRFALHIREQPVNVYAPTPAEDVFALGVTAYKLVTEQYPPSPQPVDAEFHVWKTEGPGPRPAHVLNARCRAELSALISRMLSLQPEARGSARELAEALEQAARAAGPEADALLFSGRAPWPGSPEEELPRQTAPQGEWTWLAAAGIAGAVVLGTPWVLSALASVEDSREQAAAQEEARDAGTVGLGDSVLTAPVASPQVPFSKSPVAEELPEKPLPGQLRPDARGRCPEKSLVPIHGGCWIRVGEDLKECRSYSYIHKGTCYVPALNIQPRPATSGPAESRDGG
ncbi:MAG TPA: serine/threonine-protein kinase [Myxococcus sp.]|nr:serine/threonine-protein kinase [Myxococcus sp.]